jgi:hypothetical protein
MAPMQGLEASSQYERFAEERDRLAGLVETDRHRHILERMAEAWRRLVEEENAHG